jgi:aminopeptidase-like protein
LDLYRTIRTLHEERKRLENLIASLEELQVSKNARSPQKPAAGRRGRKGMSASEREKVSERMKNYWAARRSDTRSREAASPQPSASTAS